MTRTSGNPERKGGGRLNRTAETDRTRGTSPEEENGRRDAAPGADRAVTVPRGHRVPQPLRVTLAVPMRPRNCLTFPALVNQLCAHVCSQTLLSTRCTFQRTRGKKNRDTRIRAQSQRFIFLSKGTGLNESYSSASACVPCAACTWGHQQPKYQRGRGVAGCNVPTQTRWESEPVTAPPGAATTLTVTIPKPNCGQLNVDVCVWPPRLLVLAREPDFRVVSVLTQ